MEDDEPGQLVEICLTAQPYLFELLFAAPGNLETVHGDIHCVGSYSCLSANLARRAAPSRFARLAFEANFPQSASTLFHFSLSIAAEARATNGKPVRHSNLVVAAFFTNVREDQFVILVEDV